MTTSTKWRRRSAGWAIALSTAAAATTAMSVPAAAEQTAIWCPTGYVCLQPADAPNWPVLLKEGDARNFPGGLKVNAVSNQTRLVYCVISNPFSYGLAPRQEAVRDHIVLAVGPSRICPT